MNFIIVVFHPFNRLMLKMRNHPAEKKLETMIIIKLHNRWSIISKPKLYKLKLKKETSRPFMFVHLLLLHKELKQTGWNPHRKGYLITNRLKRDLNQNKNFRFSKKMTYVKVLITILSKKQNKCFKKVKTED